MINELNVLLKLNAQKYSSLFIQIYYFIFVIFSSSLVVSIKYLLDNGNVYYINGITNYKVIQVYITVSLFMCFI
jgi:hypothetical protein